MGWFEITRLLVDATLLNYSNKKRKNAVSMECMEEYCKKRKVKSVSN
jgi:hypothetical protein